MFNKLVWFGVGTGMALYGYARYIEPNRISKRYFSVCKEKSVDKKQYCVVHFTDMHLGRFSTAKRLQRFVDEIQRCNPDILVFTGDMFDNLHAYPIDTQEAVGIMSQLQAPHGKFAVAGNHERRYKQYEEYCNFMREIGFQVLSNQWIQIPQTSLCVVGVDDMLTGHGNPKQAFADLPPTCYKLVLCHEPDVADSLAQLGGNFIFSGHSHGGQVQFPIVGATVLPPMAHQYPQGIYHLTNHGILHTGEGLGMSRIPFRFLVPPNLGVFQIEA